MDPLIPISGCCVSWPLGLLAHSLTRATCLCIILPYVSTEQSEPSLIAIHKISLVVILDGLRGPASASAIHEALATRPGCLEGLLEPVAAGLQAASEHTARVLAEAALMGPPSLQATVLGCIAGILAETPPLAPSPSSTLMMTAPAQPQSSVYLPPSSPASPSLTPSSSFGAEAGRAWCAPMAVSAIAGIAPKIDSCCPHAAADLLADNLFGILSGSLSGGRRKGLPVVSQSLGLLGRSKRLRPSLVERLAQLLEQCSAASLAPAPKEALSREPAPGNSCEQPSLLAPVSIRKTAGGQAGMLRAACASALFDIAGCPGARPDMGPALLPLVALMSPAAAAESRSTTGVAAAALFGLAAHPAFLAILRESELPGFLEVLRSSPEPLDATAASTVAALMQSLAGGGLVGSQYGGLKSTGGGGTLGTTLSTLEAYRAARARGGKA